MDSLLRRAATLDAMSYSEKRALVADFETRVTVFPGSAEERFKIDMRYDLDGWVAYVEESDFVDGSVFGLLPGTGRRA